MCMYSIFLKPAAEMFIMCINDDIMCIIVDRESVALLSELDILKFILWYYKLTSSGKYNT